MHRIAKYLANRFVESTPERILAAGVAIACIFGAAIFIAAWYENVIFIEEGIGFAENYGWFAALLGDAVLLFLAKKYFDVVQNSYQSLPFEAVRVESDQKSRIHAIAGLDDGKNRAFYFMAFIGFCFVVSNVSLQLLGETEKHWRGDVFDSPLHPATSVLNKLFLLYSWGVLVPFCAYISIFTSLYISHLAKIISETKDIKYDLLNPDRAGGFSEILAPRIYLNIGASILYLQITLYTIVFQGANIEHYVGYFFVTLLLIFGNFFIFWKIDQAVEMKRIEAISATKEDAYKGDALKLDIFKYYMETFGKRTLQMRLTRIIVSVKSVAIIIPPIIKFVLISYP